MTVNCLNNLLFALAMPGQLSTTLRAVDDATRPDVRIEKLASFAVQRGRPAIERLISAAQGPRFSILHGSLALSPVRFSRIRSAINETFPSLSSLSRRTVNPHR